MYDDIRGLNLIDIRGLMGIELVFLRHTAL